MNQTSDLVGGVEQVGFKTMDEVMREHFQKVYAAMGGNITKTAKVLGLSRSTGYRYFNRWGENGEGIGK